MLDICIFCYHSGSCKIDFFIFPLSWKMNQLATYSPPEKKSIMVCKKIKILAVREVRPNCTQSFVEKYKGLKKFIKGNFSQHIFSFFYIGKNFDIKTKHMALILRSRRFFRHPDRPNLNTSYLRVICVICHIMTFYVI